MSEANNNLQDKKVVGLLAQFEGPSSLLHACEHARDEGIQKMDSFTPFPIHGIERAMGVPRTILPFIVLAIGLSACAAGLGLQWFTNSTENWGPWSGYQFKISGKPYFSLPANIPVTFEIIVLSSAFAAFLGMFILNRLPRLAHPLHRIPRFRRATNDGFFLVVEAADPKFDLEQTRNKLVEWGATETEVVEQDLTDHQLPAFVKTAGVLLVVLMMIPPVLIFRARAMTARQTRLHVVPDMDFQIKYKPQSMGPVVNNEGPPIYFFPHQRSAQKPIPGTVARGQLTDDSEYFRGIQPGSDALTRTGANLRPVSVAAAENLQEAGAPQSAAPEAGTQEGQEPPPPPEPDWVTEFPSQIEISEKTIMRGQRMFDIYCAVCHGYAGEGDGLVSQRAVALSLQAKANWTQAKSLYDPEVVKQPVGRIYDTITNGRATMGPYATRILPEDRWAIVLYIKALHETHRNVPFVPAGTAGDAASGGSAESEAGGEP